MEGFDIVKSHYIKELLAKGTREDGRKMFDFRNMTITTDVISHAEGSAQVDLGATRVLAAVKMQVEEPMEDTPKQGNLMVSAELLQLAHAEFESGPPSPVSVELARVVDRGIRAAECIDLESLFIEEGKAWSVFIDLYVLNYNGNLFDACTAAAMAALATTKVPKLENGEAVYTEKAGPLKLNNIVVSTTFGKVDNALILDTNMHEENAASARITIANDGKVVRAMQKGLGGAFTAQEIESLVDVSLNKYTELKKAIQR
ncbi:MAG: RNA-binding protein [Candidatus Micrarchaeales archaeon]